MPQRKDGAAFANSNIVDNLRRSNFGAAHLDDSLNYLDVDTNLGRFGNTVLS
jgi:hypothetical protein